MKHKFLITCLLSFANFTGVFAQNSYEIIDKTVQFGHKKVIARKINAIIIHSTFNNSGGEKYDIDLVIKQFSQYNVSSHYVIGRNGEIYRLVKDNHIAFHAGKSQLPNGQTNLNSTTIGIELITSFDEAPTELQIQALVYLVNKIKDSHKIEFVLRHSDVAPGRKTDPWNMNWEDFLDRLKTKDK